MTKFPSLFVGGGGTLLKLLRAESSGGGASAGSAGKQRGREVVVAPNTKRRKTSICYSINSARRTRVRTVIRAELPTAFLRQPRQPRQSRTVEDSASVGGGAWGQGAHDSTGVGARAGGAASSALVVQG